MLGKGGLCISQFIEILGTDKHEVMPENKILINVYTVILVMLQKLL